MLQDSNVFDAQCAVVAFYGFHHDTAKVVAFFDRAVAWFESLGTVPTMLGSATREAIGKLGDFSRNASKLRRAGFDRVHSLEMYSPTPGRDATCTAFRLAAGYDGDRADDSHVFLAADMRVASLDDARMSLLARELAGMLRPEYGIAFTRPMKLGPTLYVSGILMSAQPHVATGKEYEDELSICRWGDIAMPKQVYREGILRDVYPFNYLHNVHLGQQVNGTTLERWIVNDVKRGKLVRLTDEISQWQVDSVGISAIRESLVAAGLVFDWHKYISGT